MVNWHGGAELSRRFRRRAKLEFLRQWPLFKERYKTILFGAAFQYVHGIFTQLAHRMAHPTKEPLHDLGFDLLPELGQKNEWVSETIFTTMLISFLVWTFSPFWQESGKRFYTAVLYARVLMVLVICQTLRIISFTVTSLPSPNYHCRLPMETAIRAWPKHWWGHILYDVQTQSTHGCGDLIFSSHTTFALVGVMSYQEYGTLTPVKALVWTGAAILSVLIVASRKHYTVDVVVAWYVVPLVFYASHRRWTTKRSAKEDWPHRPLPEESPSDLQDVIVEAAVDSQAPLLSAVQMMPAQRAPSRDLGTASARQGEMYNGTAGDQGRGGSPSSGTTVMTQRPRSTNALQEASNGGSSQTRPALPDSTSEFQPVVPRRPSLAWQRPGALMGQPREPGKATVSLARLIIDAPPSEVYAKLSRAREWNDWLTTAKIIHTAQNESLETGDTFCYTAKLAPGFIDAVVQDAEVDKVLQWGDKALFGLVRSESRWQLRKQGGGARGLWLRKPQTLITVDQEVTGPLSCIVTGKRLEAHTTSWLADLKAAIEGGSVDPSKAERIAYKSEE